jgi:hypothetical protein
MASSNGQALVVELNEQRARKAAEARAKQEAIAHRIRTLKELVHQTFVEMPKSMHRSVRWDVFTKSRERVRKLGIAGGPEYDRVLSAVRFAWNDKRSYKEAIEAVVPVELDAVAVHNAAEYESSDGQSRYSN